MNWVSDYPFVSLTGSAAGQLAFRVCHCSTSRSGAGCATATAQETSACTDVDASMFAFRRLKPRLPMCESDIGHALVEARLDAVRCSQERGSCLLWHWRDGAFPERDTCEGTSELYSTRVRFGVLAVVGW